MTFGFYLDLWISPWEKNKIMLAAFTVWYEKIQEISWEILLEKFEALFGTESLRFKF